MQTNRDQLVDILRDPAFLAGEVSTAFLDRRLESLDAHRARPSTAPRSRRRSRWPSGPATARTVQHGIPPAGATSLSQPHRDGVRGRRRRRVVRGPATAYVVDGDTVVAAGPDRGDPRGRRRAHDVRRGRHRRRGRRRLAARPRPARPGCRASPTRPTRWRAASCSRRCPAPWSGSTSRPATEVAAGQTVLVLEAMKMQHTVTAPHAGTVTEIDVTPGAQVAAGEVLAVVEETEANDRRSRSPSPRSARRCAARWPSWPSSYGREWFAEQGPRRRARPPSCGWRSPRTATSASTSPRSTAAVAAASATSPRSARSSPPRAARC